VLRKNVVPSGAWLDVVRHAGRGCRTAPGGHRESGRHGSF